MGNLIVVGITPGILPSSIGSLQFLIWHILSNALLFIITAMLANYNSFALLMRSVVEMAFERWASIEGLSFFWLCKKHFN